MTPPRPHRLLAFARELQRAQTFAELLAITAGELTNTLGYTHAWLFVGETEDSEEWRLLDYAGPNRDQAWTVAPLLRVRGDAMLEEIAAADRPVVVEDARTDPRTNKAIVEALGNRTIINVPLVLLDKPFGAFGTGTFGDEGCRVPTEDELGYLVGMASQLAVAAGRIRYLEERRVMERELERRVAERTFALENMNRDLQAFSYSVAHDLRSPLRAIAGFGAALVEDHQHSLDAEGRDYLHRIVDGSQRMTTIIDALLALARLSLAELDREAVDLSLLARSVGDQLRVLDPARTVELVVADGLVANGDHSLLRMALDNLLGNAWKFTRNQPAARIELGCDAETYFIRDNGAGFDMRMADLLFSPFHRLHSRADFEGTGIGLATVERIISRHGGRIWAEAAVDRGATFRFTLA
ncbi:MAG: ATP-binding protein [Kofleriaceae bacterium]